MSKPKNIDSPMTWSKIVERLSANSKLKVLHCVVGDQIILMEDGTWKKVEELATIKPTPRSTSNHLVLMQNGVWKKCSDLTAEELAEKNISIVEDIPTNKGNENVTNVADVDGNRRLAAIINPFYVLIYRKSLFDNGLA